SYAAITSLPTRRSSDLVSSKTILAVDSDATVLMFVSTLLRQKGHHVLEAKSGVKALEILNMFPTKIHFLVVDVNMEPINGHEVRSEEHTSELQSREKLV